MSERIERRLRLSGLLIIAGLAIQLGTLFWNHPLTFLAFIVLGTPLVALGIVVYLVSVVSTSQ